MIRLRALLCLLFIYSFSIFAQTTKPQQLVGLEAILAELETHYGMAEYKAKTYGVTTDTLRAKYTDLIARAQTLEEGLGLDPVQKREILPPDEFRQLMIGMIAELRDGHVNLNRQDKQFSFLGINGASIGEKLYVTEVRKDLMTKNSAMKAIQPGDEVVALDGVPVVELAKRNLLYAAGGTFEDRWQTAMLTVINNPHSVMRAKPEGEKVSVTFRRDTQEYTAILRWVETSDYVFLTQLFPKDFAARGKVFSEDLATTYGMRGTVRSYFRTGLLARADLADSMIDVGEILNQDIKKAKAATGGGNEELKKLEPVYRLTLHLVRYKGRNVAVFRLPNFSPPNGINDFRNEYLWLAQGLKRLEKLSDVMVLDQLSNTGGSVYYATRLLSLFASKNRPLTTLMANLKLNETYLENLRPSYSIDPVYKSVPVHVDLKLYEKFYDELRAKFDSGAQWSGLMPALDLQTEELSAEPGEIYPAQEGVYSKEILLISDKMSGSMGDSFSAILQSNQRAKIYGETSCGLGGSLYRNTGSMPGSQLSMRCTSTYQELPDGWPLEGIGTVPDIFRDIRISDLRDGFKTYAQDVLNEAVAMTGVQPSAVKASPPDNPKPDSARAQLIVLTKKMQSSPVEAYPALAAKMVAVLGHANESEWKNLVIPLPDLLLQDLILKTLWRRLDVLYRLREMRELPAWQAHRDLIDAAMQVAGALTETAHFADPCELRLRMKPLKKSQP